MFSVIIPVHNSEKTLERCLDSLLKQTYGDFEAILVENGSSDSSLDICNRYVAEDRRFKVIDIGKCNGPSKPRNIGLKKASGEFIAFLDSDDCFSSGLLEMLKKCFFQHSADIVFFGFCVTKNEVSSEIHFPIVTVKEKSEMCIQLKAQDCFGYTCCKAFRKRILNGVFFDETINLFEDEIFVLAAVEKSDVIIVVPNYYNSDHYYYHVYESEKSLMNRTHKDIVKLKDAEYNAWKKYLKDLPEVFMLDMANKSVSFCRYYAFEHNLNIKKSYIELKQSDFYRDAMLSPEKTAKLVSKGLNRFRLDWLIWKIKTTLKR